jgi:VIT1/CCC1 family predicted Fe2+/Mn2+ transporter
MDDADRRDHRAPGPGTEPARGASGALTARAERHGPQQRPRIQPDPPPGPAPDPAPQPDPRPAQPQPGPEATAAPSARPARTPGPPPPDHHRDVAGGWLRPAVFGAMDGLVTNVSLISGVGAGGGSSHALALTGVAGLVAGAFSMATGEYVSVTSQNELVAREVEAERRELARNPVGEQAELAAALRSHGVEGALAEQVASQISARPDRGLGLHVREELGVDHEDLPSPYTAAGASFAAFTVGALVPLLPYLVGAANLPFALGLSAVAALAGGGAVGRLTARPVWRGALRQLLLGALAAGATFLIGLAVGTSVG